MEVSVTDPLAEGAQAEHQYCVKLMSYAESPWADAIVAAVSHSEFAELSMDDVGKKLVTAGAFIDVKSAVDQRVQTQAGLSL